MLWSKTKNITIENYGEQNVKLYFNTLQTNQQYLIDAMQTLDISLVGENGPYGFIFLTNSFATKT